MPANTLQTYTVVRQKEDVDDKIYRVSPEETPFVSMIGRDKVHNTTPEWQREALRAPGANAALEGADASYAAQAQPEMLSNKTQIIQDTLSVSGTTEAVKLHARASEVARLKSKKMVELKKDVEYSAIVNGAFVAGAAATARQMRGLYGWCQTNNELGAGGAAPNVVTNTAPTAGTLRAVSETLLKSLILKVYSAGGKASVLMTSPSHKQAISAFTGNVQRTNEVGGGAKKLNTSFSVYGHDFGETKVVPNRVMAGAGAGGANTAYLFDPEQFKLGVLRPFGSEELAKVGDAENWQILTEVTLKCLEERAGGAIRDLTA